VNLISTRSPAIAAYAVQENAHVTETGGSTFPGGATSVNTQPLATTPQGADCAATNNYPLGTIP
jgi:hypothetical protein